MALIELTSEERNGKAYAKTILLNTDTIAVPIREVGGKSYIGVNESILSGRPSENLDIVFYLVTEDLATVVGLSYDLFSATVITRDGRTPSTGYNDLIFRLDRVVGNIAAEGSGSKFMYHEDNGTLPVEFVVSQAPSVIISQVTIPPIPPIPPIDTVKRYKAFLTQTEVLLTSGLLVIGQKYLITNLLPGDDFSNVGAIVPGAAFIATGTTPTNWSNGSTVLDGLASAPVATVQSNNLGGTVSFDYYWAGTCVVTGTGLFTVGKTNIYFGDNYNGAIYDSLYTGTTYLTLNDFMMVVLDGLDNAAPNGLLHTMITIEVYP